MIKLASGNNAADAVDTGFYSKYNEGSTIKYAGLFKPVVNANCYQKAF